MKRLSFKNFFVIIFSLFLLIFVVACNNVEIQNGENGVDGIDGKDGKDGKDGENGQKGDDGRKPELKVDEEGLWWRLEGDTEWTKLMSIEDLAGHSEKYTISLKIDDEVYSTIENVTYKTTVEIEEPYKENYTFIGWEYENGEEYKDTDLITTNITLKAIFGSRVRALISTIPSTEEAFGINKELVATHYNTYGAYRGEEIVYRADNEVNVNWTNIGLRETYLPGYYEVTGIGTSEEVSITHPTSLVLYHINCTSSYYDNAKTIAENKESFIGNLVKITNIPTDDPSLDCEISFKFYTVSLSQYEDVKVDEVVKIGEKVTLPAIDDVNFLGWSKDNGETIVNGEITPNSNETYLPVYKQN